MLGRRHRRSLYTYSATEKRSGVWTRVVIAALALCLLWFVGSKIVVLFDGSIVNRTSATLRIEPSQLDAVQITLQGAEPQRAENNVKLYAGDTILTKMGGSASVSFFDGTNIRLDEATEMTVLASQRAEGSEESQVEVSVQAGRVWVSTPSESSFSGSILRLIRFPGFEATLTNGTHALFSTTSVSVMKASGLGLSITLSGTGESEPVIIGEGQMLTLTEDAVSAIENGKSPYEFRDPITQQILRDPFLIRSYTLTLQAAEAIAAPGASTADLTIQSPKNSDVVSGQSVRVAGTVSSRIKSLTVNGYLTSLSANGTFSTDLNISGKTNVVIRVEGQDAQGITIAEEERTITAAPAALGKALRITSPASAGETYTTNQSEFEMTGEANADTKAVVVNGYTLQLYKPGSRTWSYLLSTRLGNLVEGKNALTVYGIDANDRKTESATLTVIYDPSASAASVNGSASSAPPLKQNQPITPGVLSVEKPVSGLSGTTQEREVLIEGKTSTATDSVYVNGYRLSLYQSGKDFWNYIASVDLGTMKDGKNVYRVVSRNADGEILDVLEYTLTKE